MIKDEIKKELLTFLSNRFELPFQKDPNLNEDTHLFDEGYLDSMDSLVLSVFLEKTFSTKINPQEMNTINDIVECVYLMKGQV